MFMGGDDLQNWARSAEPGTSLCLGVGSAIPSGTQPAIRSLSDAGVIDFARRRIGPERYSFVVQRRSARFVDRPAPRHAPTIRRAGTAERRVLKLLIAAAERDLPCPTNAAIAKAAKLSGELAASYRVRRLAAAGKIRVEVPSDPRLHRVVTIVASGKSTRGGAR